MLQSTSVLLISCDNVSHCSPAGATVQVGIDPSKVVVTKLRLDKDRKKLLERKKGKGAADGNKFSEQDGETMENVD